MYRGNRWVSMPVFENPEWNELTQSEKILEEAQEVCQAVQDEHDRESIIEETLDVIQASFNMLHVIHVSQEEINRGFHALATKHERRGYISPEDEYVLWSYGWDFER